MAFETSAGLQKRFCPGCLGRFLVMPPGLLSAGGMTWRKPASSKGDRQSQEGRGHRGAAVRARVLGMRQFHKLAVELVGFAIFPAASKALMVGP
jgi:hypothetical protein